MATAEQVSALRLLIAEPDDTDPYTTTTLFARIDAAGADLDRLAYEIWTEKAAAFATLVDISEGGSSRKSGDLHEQALAMAKVFADRAIAGEAPPGSSSRTRVYRLTRA